MPYSLEQLQHVLVGKNQSDITSGLPLNELTLPVPASFANVFVDTGLMEVPARIKTLVIVVDSALTSAVAGQATVQLFAARSKYATAGSGAGVSAPGPPVNASNPFLGASGATSQFPTSGLNASQAVGPAVNFAGNVNSIPTGVYFFTSTSPGNPSASPPTSMTELAQWYPVLGVEVKAAVAFTGGSFRAFFELAPI